MNFHIETFSDKYDFPENPDDRPILVSTGLNVDGNPLKVLSHIRFDRLSYPDGMENPPTLHLVSDLFLVTDTDHDQIVKLIQQRQQS